MNAPGNKPKIAIAPIAYYWSRSELLDFYAAIAESAADIIYLGETVCSKRRALCGEEWFELAQQLHACGKEVVLSTLTLIEAESELSSVKRTIHNGKFAVECNDMSAVYFAIEQQLPFITGPAINIYNAHTLLFLIKRGLKRWVPCVELSRDAIEQMITHVSQHMVETEIFSYGFLPLAYSARCFTARQYQLRKDDCQFLCNQHPTGIVLSTQENHALFRINGIQTQSFEACNLLPLYNDMTALGAHSVRLSLSSQDELEVIERVDRLRRGEDLTPTLLNTGGVNGFWWGQAGMSVNG